VRQPATARQRRAAPRASPRTRARARTPALSTNYDHVTGVGVASSLARHDSGCAAAAAGCVPAPAAAALVAAQQRRADGRQETLPRPAGSLRRLQRTAGQYGAVTPHRSSYARSAAAAAAAHGETRRSLLD